MNPIKPNIKTEIIPIVILLLMIGLSFYFYSVFPDQVPTHWNTLGEVDAYSSKELGAFLFPAIAVGMYLLFFALPFMDPKKERYDQFRKTYHVFKAMMLMFFAIMYVVTGLSAMGFEMNILLWVNGMAGILFIVLGNYMAKLKPNWFMGIKTPWTLSSEEVWNKTHRFGSKVFILAGFLFLLTSLIPTGLRLFYFIFIILMILAGTIGYSYFAYRKIEKKKVDNKQ